MDPPELEPPAKRTRFDAPADGTLDVPRSPVDDMDDDFYDTSPVKLPSSAPNPEDRPVASPNSAPSATSPSSLSIPGLGFLGAAPALPKQDGPHHDDEMNEDGEISDSEDLYNEAQPAENDPENQDAHISEDDATAPLEAALLGEADDTLANGIAADGSALDHLQAANGQLGGLTQAKSANKHASDTGTPLQVPQQPMPDITSFASSSTPAKVENTGDARAEFVRAAKANIGNPNAEFQFDSSDGGSSDSSSSKDSDEDSSEEGEASEDEGELLDPEEQVRRLMAESTDDLATAAKAKIKTLNEVAEEYKKPDIPMTEDTKITYLGAVESVVDNLILIKANVSGDYQVLSQGSPLCLENRTIIGEVSETLGRVREPRYSLGFPNASEIASLGIAKDTKVFYVDEHSGFVFTEPLRKQKFTDASNLHDEETNDVEFSDDEKEAEFKRSQKEAKRAKIDAGREHQDAPAQPPHTDVPVPSQPQQYQGGGLNYGEDDDDDDDGMYRPVRRPDHFEDIVGAGAPLEDRSHVRRGAMRGRGGWPDRGRGFRGRGGFGGPPGGGRGDRGNRFARGSDRGDKRGRQQDRGRQSDHNRPRNAMQQREQRSASSASPARQKHGRPQGPQGPQGQQIPQGPQAQQAQQAPQHSPPRGKKRQRKHRSPANPTQAPAQASTPAPTSAPHASASANAYAQNSAINTAGWSMPGSAAAYPPTNYYSTAGAPAVPAGAYANANANMYGQQSGQQAPQQGTDQYQQQQQQNLVQWAQWLQFAAAMNQQAAPSSAAGQGHAQPPPNNSQAGEPSLHDILRTLGGGRGP
ncbi:NAF1-domain-containing protein [Polyplosphaeria fusca]|uniref:H/ACA ribonucleoprotein complex non-core subunit NAF1 n=1 Tax=Polyplosphaeria fusca TaxID=682080 RepID=A0A9P4R9S8_9PLEO|nr:NAF1-domain-containing protein [Polyplosphaeria fusca]